MKIIIYTYDTELFENIKLYTSDSNNNEFILSKQIDKDSIIDNNFDIIIIDNFNKKFNSLSKTIKKTNENVLYIGNDKENKIINTIKIPINLNFLIDKINNIISFYKNNIVEYNFGKFNFNNKTFISSKNKIIEFTEQENTFLNLIIKKNIVNKILIIKHIWNSYNNEQLLNNLVYNIKKKLRNISIDNCIFCENDNFFIGKQ